MTHVYINSTKKGSKFKPISTEELSERINNPDIKIIDVRSVDAYNGWKERNEQRGGHIKGAKNFSAKWTKYIDRTDIINSKNIQPNHSIILYGYDPTETERMATLFAKLGHEDVCVYHDFVNEWSADNTLPMQKLARYTQLVSPNWLHQLITTNSAPEYSNDKFVICHAHYRNRADYEKGHIPGAVDLDTNRLESEETWNCRSSEELKKVFEDMGITHDTTVILYGRFSFPNNDDPYPGSSAGHLGAFRCAFIMLYAGVKDVRMLNGGVQSWIDDGFDLTQEEPSIKSASEFGAQIPSKPELRTDLSQAQEILDSRNKNLVSVRSWKEFIGEESGYNYIKKKGRIPGAIFGDCGSDAYHMENYRNLDYTCKEFHEVEENWTSVGITPDKHNAFYCGTGWRGSEAFFNAWLMGWPSISLFDGGWYEWSNNNYPYETGVPQNVEA